MPDATPDGLFDRGWRRTPAIYVRSWISPDGERIVPEPDALAELAQGRGEVPPGKAKGKAA
jgi:hypothetical protein